MGAFQVVLVGAFQVALKPELQWQVLVQVICMSNKRLYELAQNKEPLGEIWIEPEKVSYCFYSFHPYLKISNIWNRLIVFRC